MEALKRAIPTKVRNWLSRKRLELGRKSLWADRLANFGALRRVTPYRPAFGWHRGQCIDRYYIEKFLSSHQADIHGAVLEIAEPEYTLKFGGSRVTRSDVLDLDPQNSKANIHDDLTAGAKLVSDVYDCIVCTQTLMYIYDAPAAIRTMMRILKPGGVLLATVPGIAQICPASMMGAGEDYWRFTRYSAVRMFADVSSAENVSAETYGSVLSAVGLLHGLVTEEFTHEELDHHDPDYEVTIGIRARKKVQ